MSQKARKSLHNLRMTLVCGMMTILVLRGTIGAGNFGTPSQDFNSIQQHLRKDHGRLLKQIVVDSNAQVDGEEFLTTYSLGPKISDWDEQRMARTEERNKIMMVTGSQPGKCDNPSGDNFLLRSLKNKVDYCRLHGIQLFHNTASVDQDLTGFWAKLPLLRRLMTAHPEIEWFWWLDSDAVITDMDFALPMDKYADHNLVMHGWDHEVYERKSWLGLNTGSFLIRNCQWSLDLLEAWAPMGPKGTVRMRAGEILTRNLEGRPRFEADDQSALVFLLGKRHEMWGAKVFLENTYYLHGYWVPLVDSYEKLETKPFVTHFVGCKPCGKNADYPEQKCSDGMERAFNFADDQVLAKYGLQHISLSTTDVKSA